MSYELERVESWARKIYEEATPGGAPWSQISYAGALAGERWRVLARAALKVHLECCEQRCRKCKQVFIHWCASCDRS